MCFLNSECSLAAFLCRSGGIGRRAWFRSMYPQGCGGSSPFFGTNSAISNYLEVPHLRSGFRLAGSDAAKAPQVRVPSSAPKFSCQWSVVGCQFKPPRANSCYFPKDDRKVKKRKQTDAS